MLLYIPALLLCSLLTVTSAIGSSDDLINQIHNLEQQIKELKLLKEQQKLVSDKEDLCFKAIGRGKFCKCLAMGLPREISFEQYIHIQVTPKNELGYDSMTPVQQSSIDSTLNLRDKCVEKGFFK